MKRAAQSSSLEMISTLPPPQPEWKAVGVVTGNYRNMPWYGCELWLGDPDEAGDITSATLIAGGKENRFASPNGRPMACSTLFQTAQAGGISIAIRIAQARHSCRWRAIASPQWVFGMSRYAFESAQRLVCTYTQDGMSHLGTLDTTTLRFQEIATPYTLIGDLCASSGTALFLAASPQSAEAPEPGLAEQQNRSLTAIYYVEHRCGVFIDAPGHRVSHRELGQRGWHLLSATQQGFQRTGTNNADPGDEPRRSHFGK